jgi:hypothetical protein
MLQNPLGRVTARQHSRQARGPIRAEDLVNGGVEQPCAPDAGPGRDAVGRLPGGQVSLRARKEGIPWT